MTQNTLSATLTGMEEEIKILKAQIKERLKPPKNLTSFTEMEGFWKGKADFSWEDIQKVKTKVSNPIP